MIGIYKITNPKGRVYIGQSTDIDYRWRVYKRLRCKTQPKLYRSIMKYGIDDHKFEIVTECDIEQLNELERYYQELYNCIGKGGLNCLLTIGNGEKARFSEETRIKMRNSQLGKKRSPESIKKQADSNRGKKRSSEFCERLRKANLGKKHSPETIEKFKQRMKGYKPSVETRAKISTTLRKKYNTEEKEFNYKNRILKSKLPDYKRPPVSEETREKRRIASTGRKMSKESTLKRLESRKGFKHSEETKAKLRLIGFSDLAKERCVLANKGRKLSAETIKKIADKLRGIKRGPMPKEQREKVSINSADAVIVINIENGVFYESIKKAAESINMRPNLLVNRLCGHKKHNETLIRYAH